MNTPGEHTLTAPSSISTPRSLAFFSPLSHSLACDSLSKWRKETYEAEPCAPKAWYCLCPTRMTCFVFVFFVREGFRARERKKKKEEEREREKKKGERGRGRGRVLFSMACFFFFSINAHSFFFLFFRFSLTSDTPNAVAILASDPTLCFFDTLWTTR